MYNILEKNKNINNFEGRFLKLFQYYGAKIIYSKKKLDKKVNMTCKRILSDISKKVKNKNFSDIANARNISVDEAEEIKKGDIYTKDEIFALKKRNIATVFNKDIKEIDENFVSKYGSKNNIAKRRRRNDITRCKNMKDSLNNIFKKESFNLIIAKDNIDKLGIDLTIWKHKISLELLEMLGINTSNIKDFDQVIGINEDFLKDRLINLSNFIAKYYEDFRLLYNKPIYSLLNSKDWTFHRKMQFVNGIFRSTYNVSITKKKNVYNFWNA